VKIKPNCRIFRYDDGWRVGDDVACLESTLWEVGKIYTLEAYRGNEKDLCFMDGSFWNGYSGVFQLVEKGQFQYEMQF